VQKVVTAVRSKVFAVLITARFTPAPPRLATTAVETADVHQHIAAGMKQQMLLSTKQLEKKKKKKVLVILALLLRIFSQISAAGTKEAESGITQCQVV
jgi:hypothetical protein